MVYYRSSPPESGQPRMEMASHGNIFNQKGITCVGIATGYFKNHSTEESLHLDDFYQAGERVARIIGRIA